MTTMQTSPRARFSKEIALRLGPQHGVSRHGDSDSPCRPIWLSSHGYSIICVFLLPFSVFFSPSPPLPPLPIPPSPFPLLVLSPFPSPTLSLSLSAYCSLSLDYFLFRILTVVMLELLDRCSDSLCLSLSLSTASPLFY